jgi:hypothetical protein
MNGHAFVGALSCSISNSTELGGTELGFAVPRSGSHKRRSRDDMVLWWEPDSGRYVDMSACFPMVPSNLESGSSGEFWLTGLPG